MFSDWKCASGETEMTPGDTLLLFTDGITEATNKDGEEFGEAGLIEAFAPSMIFQSINCRTESSKR
jgi:serine phosphatase RsbU (regulator of sigma subunit)